MSMFKDIWNVATYEVMEAIRSKRVLVLSLLYLGGAVVGSYMFVNILQGIEDVVADSLAGKGSAEPGAVTEAMLASDDFRSLLGSLLGDDDIAAEVATLPPLAVFYGWLALAFAPVIVTLTAADTVSGELASGSIRFQLLRVSRAAYSLGKLLGQSLLMVSSIFLGGAAVLAVGAANLPNIDLAETGIWILRLSARACVFGFAYVGLVVGVSHTTRSVPLARGLSLVALMAMGALSMVLGFAFFEDSGVIVSALRAMLPGSHQLELWQPGATQRLTTLLWLCTLGAFYFGSGYLFRLRRDL